MLTRFRFHNNKSSDLLANLYADFYRMSLLDPKVIYSSMYIHSVLYYVTYSSCNYTLIGLR